MSTMTESNVIGPISENDFRLMTMLRTSLKRFKDMGNPPKYASMIKKEEDLLAETMNKYTKKTVDAEDLAQAA